MSNLALDISSPSTTPSQAALVGQQLVIGRGKEAQIFLDSRTISRRHAEIVHDPFGRWWIRDLGSHNGTLVNGQRIKEHLLKPGDLVQVGEFSLKLSSSVENPAEPAASTAGVTMSDEGGGRIAALKDFEPPRLGAAHLSILSEFGQELMGLENPGQRLSALCRLMVRAEFHGRSALALRASKESFTEAAKPLCDPQAAPGNETLSPYISRTLVRTLLARNEPVLASNAQSAGAKGAGGGGAEMAELSLAADVMTISAVACPIKSERDYTDLLYVLFPPEFGNSEWLALTALAVKQFQQAQTTWAARKLGEDHAAIERELNRAHAIQERLVPRELAIPGLDYAIGFTPCRWVGGDYVDLIKAPEAAGGKILLTIADVCGKGLPAALVASSLHMMTHTAMRTGTPLTAIMRDLNIYLSESLTPGTFVTMLAALLEPQTGKLEMINAGHPAGLFVSPTGEVTQTQMAANLPLGIDPEAEPHAETTTMNKGEYLVLFTDGLTELSVGEGQLLGDEALAEHVARLIQAHHAEGGTGDSAAILAEKLSSLLDSLQVGMAQDDRTFLIARRV